MPHRYVIAGWVVAAALAGAAQAKGTQVLAAGCSGCHGTNGIAVAGTAPLAGRSPVELARLLRDYKAGTRAGTVMPQLAKGYTDAEIDALAEWFSTQKAAR